MTIIKKSFISAFCAIALLSTAFAGDENSWTLSLSGVGSTITSGNTGTSLGADLSLGRTGELVLPLEAGVRQGIVYGDGTTILSTRLYADWTVLTVKSLDVFAGGNVGITYGNTSPVWTAAPEAGVRWWVQEDVAILFRAEAPFDITNETFSDNIRYTVGFRVDF